MEKKKKLQHVLLMEENNILLEDLPKDIKLKINALKPTIARFNSSNPPSEKLEMAIIKQDIGIAEMIANYIEKDLPDANEEDIDEPEIIAEKKEEVVDVAPASNVSTEQVVIEEPVIAAPVIETRVRKYKDGTLDQEKQIRLECQNNNGFIETEKLVSILGKTKWQLSLSTEEVYSIVIRKVYAHNLYKLVD
jgi:hypothetical protein